MHPFLHNRALETNDPSTRRPYTTHRRHEALWPRTPRRQEPQACATAPIANTDELLGFILNGQSWRLRAASRCTRRARSHAQGPRVKWVYMYRKARSLQPARKCGGPAASGAVLQQETGLEFAKRPKHCHARMCSTLYTGQGRHAPVPAASIVLPPPLTPHPSRGKHRKPEGRKDFGFCRSGQTCTLPVHVGTSKHLGTYCTASLIFGFPNV